MLEEVLNFMRGNKLVSIIIPVYQVEQYLAKCLTTVTQQTYSNLEIILVDDGSHDNSPKICDEWAKKDQRIKVIHKKNGGLSDARNVGLNNATGNYIAFVDSDDWIAVDMINKLVMNLEKTNADMAVCQFANVFPDGRVQRNTLLGKSPQVFSRHDFLEYLLKDDAITNHVWRKLYKRNLIPNDVFPKGKNFEDIYAMPDFIKNCKKIVCIDDVEYFYRLNNKGLVHTINMNKYWDSYTATMHSYYHIIGLEPSLKLKADNMIIQKLIGILKEIYDNKQRLAGDEEEKRLIQSIKRDIPRNSSVRCLGKRDRIFYYFLFNFPAINKIYFPIIGSDYSSLKKIKGHWRKH